MAHDNSWYCPSWFLRQDLWLARNFPSVLSWASREPRDQPVSIPQDRHWKHNPCSCASWFCLFVYFVAFCHRCCFVCTCGLEAQMQILMFVKPALYLLSTSTVQCFYVRQSTLFTTNSVLNKITLLFSNNTYHMRKEKGFFFQLSKKKTRENGKDSRRPKLL